MPSTLHPGDTLDHFHLDSVVATSGMATVFRARDLATGRQVAIKVPHPEIQSDPTLFDRFQREEDIGTKLDHPGIMKVLPNPDRTQVYMVMEWLDGRLLRQILNDDERLPIDRAVALTIAICHALEHIHHHGVVHRDLKPENIMVDAAPDGSPRIRLIDFGIASSAGARRLTFANFSQSMGTPDYISPEQVRGKRGDARSDVFSLGVMLYEMLTGELPFHGPNPFAAMNDRLLREPVPPRQLNAAIPPALQEILFRALEREPRNRYASAREFAHDLEHPAEVGLTHRSGYTSPPQPGHRRLLLYTGLALLPIAIFLLLLLVARAR